MAATWVKCVPLGSAAFRELSMHQDVDPKYLQSKVVKIHEENKILKLKGESSVPKKIKE